MRYLFATLVGSVLALAFCVGSGNGQTPAQDGASVPASMQRVNAPALVEPSSPDVEELRRQIEKLKALRNSLADTREESLKNRPADRSAESGENARLRQRVKELLDRATGKTEPTRPPSSPEVEPTLQNPVVAPSTAKEVSVDSSPEPATEPTSLPDPLALAQVLFRNGKTESALKTFRLVKLANMGAQERVPVQYLMAACLRKLGKTDDAAAMFREIANSRADEQIAACAQWQLDQMRWKASIKAQLQELRERSNAVQP